MDVLKVASESKRIADKLNETQRLAERSTLDNKYLGIMTVPEKEYPKDQDKGKVLCGWREEDDRYSLEGQTLRYNLQVLYGNEHPEMMARLLNDLFQADHDSRQFEQYELENASRQSMVLLPPRNKVEKAIIRGLRALFVLIIFLTSSAKVKAQGPGLQAGEPVPDVTMSQMINYQTVTAKLSDFKGKLLILNFWSTSCPASVALLRQMVNLQKAFPDNLQIIAVGKEDLATVKSVASAKGLSGLAFATNNNQLAGMFPHELVPQLVWISGESKVLGITTDYDATEATVKKLINRERTVFKDPKADQTGFDSDKPLFLNDNGKAGTYLHRSVLTAYSNGLPEVLGINRDSSQFRIYAVNQGRLQLYVMAMQIARYSWPKSRVLYQGVDTSKFLIKNLVEEKWDKTYCYELSLPLFFEDRAYAIMLHDLQKLFGATAAIEKRTVQCYVLSAIPGKLKPETKGGKPGNNFQSAGREEKWMNHSQLSELTAYLQEMPGYLPVLDETGYKQAVDLRLGNNLRDLNSLNRSLARYGLQMQKQERRLDMLVISEIDVPAPLTQAR